MREIKTTEDLQATIAEGYSGPAVVHIGASAGMPPPEMFACGQWGKSAGFFTRLRWKARLLRERIRNAWLVFTGQADLAEEDDD